MESREQLYKKLRELYSGTEAKSDSITKGREIATILNSIIANLVSPFTPILEASIGKFRFDGEIPIGRGRSILYEIHAGTLSRFRYDYILEVVRNTYFARKTYLLVIAYNFAEDDKKSIRELTGKIVTDKIETCFIDYETLISLDEFSSKIQIDQPDKDLKSIKRLFLEALLASASAQSNSIVSQRLFDGALSFAVNRLHFEKQEPEKAMDSTELFKSSWFEISERRLDKLEELLRQLLGEIQGLREELKRKKE